MKTELIDALLRVRDRTEIDPAEIRAFDRVSAQYSRQPLSSFARHAPTSVVRARYKTEMGTEGCATASGRC
jgi:hypothetical protein